VETVFGLCNNKNAIMNLYILCCGFMINEGSVINANTQPHPSEGHLFEQYNTGNIVPSLIETSKIVSLDVVIEIVSEKRYTRYIH